MKQIIVTAYRVLALFLCLLGLAIQLGLFSGTFNPGTLIFFTIQSNIVCAALWIALLIRPKLPAVWHGVAAQGILLTMVVYHFLLAGGSFSMSSLTDDLYGMANLLMHYVVPAMMIVDFLFLASPKRLTPVAPLWWTLFPIAYFAFAMVHGLSGRPVWPGAGTSYTYFFIDPASAGFTGDPQGFAGVMLWTLIISVAYIAAGYVMFGMYALMRTFRKAA